MISDFLINQIAEETKNKVKRAEVVVNGNVEKVGIYNKDVKDNLIKIFVNTTTKNGTITDVRLLDDKDRVLISKPAKIIKTAGYGIVSSFYIRIVEEEVKDPISIFEMRGVNNG